MEVAIVTVIGSIITGLITFFGTRNKVKSEYSYKIKEIERNYDIKIKSLENDLILKDKDIEAIKINHELELKSKEADTMNPFIAQWVNRYMEDPEGVTKQLEMAQGGMSKISGLQGHKKKKK